MCVCVCVHAHVHARAQTFSYFCLLSRNLEKYIWNNELLNHNESKLSLTFSLDFVSLSDRLHLILRNCLRFSGINSSQSFVQGSKLDHMVAFQGDWVSHGCGVLEKAPGRSLHYQGWLHLQPTE